MARWSRIGQCDQDWIRLHQEWWHHLPLPSGSDRLPLGWASRIVKRGRDADGAVPAVAEEGVALSEVGHGAPDLYGRSRERIAVRHHAAIVVQCEGVAGIETDLGYMR